MEEFDRAAPRNARGGKELRPRGIGAFFLPAGIGQELAQRGLLPGHQHAHRRIGRAGGSRRHPQQQREDRDPAGGVHAARIDRVPAHHVAQLVRHHALHLVGVVGHADQARIDVDRLPTRDKSVHFGVVDQHDVDILAIKLRGGNQRAGHVAEQRLGLGVAQDRLGQHGRGQQCCGKQRQQAGEAGVHHYGDASTPGAEPRLKNCGAGDAAVASRRGWPATRSVALPRAPAAPVRALRPAG